MHTHAYTHIYTYTHMCITCRECVNRTWGIELSVFEPGSYCPPPAAPKDVKAIFWAWLLLTTTSGAGPRGQGNLWKNPQIKHFPLCLCLYTTPFLFLQSSSQEEVRNLTHNSRLNKFGPMVLDHLLQDLQQLSDESDSIDVMEGKVEEERRETYTKTRSDRRCHLRKDMA